MTHNGVFFAVGLIVGLCLALAARAQNLGTTSGELTIAVSPASCAIVIIGDKDDEVTVDWKCVDEAVKQRDTIGYTAKVMKAIRDGKAKSR